MQLNKVSNKTTRAKRERPFYWHQSHKIMCLHLKYDVPKQVTLQPNIIHMLNFPTLHHISSPVFKFEEKLFWEADVQKCSNFLSIFCIIKVVSVMHLILLLLNSLIWYQCKKQIALKTQTNIPAYVYMISEQLLFDEYYNAEFARVFCLCDYCIDIIQHVVNLLNSSLNILRNK